MKVIWFYLFFFHRLRIENIKMSDSAYYEVTVLHPTSNIIEKTNFWLTAACKYRIIMLMVNKKCSGKDTIDVLPNCYATHFYSVHYQKYA